MPGLVPAHVVGGRYRLERLIALGGMGQVWEATDEVLGRSVALKLLRPELAADPAFRRRFRQEARHAAALSDPGIASVYDYGDDGAASYVVMELVRGEPLSELLARTSPLPPQRAVRLASAAAVALGAAHRAGIVHRDVKPGNLLVTHADGVKVTDFGIARAVDAAALTATGTVAGTAAYMSPEQASGRAVTPASDVYALGVVLYEMLAGRRPFAAESPVALAMAHVGEAPPPLPASVPASLGDLVMSALAKDPDRRPRDGAAFAGALRSATPGIANLSPAAPPSAVAVEPTAVVERTAVMPHGRARPAPVGRRRAWGTALGLAAVAAVAAVGWTAGTSLPDAVGDREAAVVEGATSATVAPTSAAVLVDAADVVGREAAVARAALESSGLVVTERVVSDSSGAAPGTVVGVEPVGSLAPGSGVTLLVAAAPPTTVAPTAPITDPPDDEGDGDRRGRGEGNGKGKGRDGGDDG